MDPRKQTVAEAERILNAALAGKAAPVLPISETPRLTSDTAVSPEELYGNPFVKKPSQIERGKKVFPNVQGRESDRSVWRDDPLPNREPHDRNLIGPLGKAPLRNRPIKSPVSFEKATPTGAPRRPSDLILRGRKLATTPGSSPTLPPWVHPQSIGRNKEPRLLNVVFDNKRRDRRHWRLRQEYRDPLDGSARSDRTLCFDASSASWRLINQEPESDQGETPHGKRHFKKNSMSVYYDNGIQDWRPPPDLSENESRTDSEIELVSETLTPMGVVTNSELQNSVTPHDPKPLREWIGSESPWDCDITPRKACIRLVKARSDPFQAQIDPPLHHLRPKEEKEVTPNFEFNSYTGRSDLIQASMN